MSSTGVITIGIDPEFQLGPLTASWHGLMIAVGVLAGGWLALRFGRERGLNTDELVNLIGLIAVAGIVGSRLFYLVQHDPGALVRPADLVGDRGFSFYGAIIVGTAATGAYVWRRGLGLRYLDALASGFPLGMAVGRIGDVINGEHYGPPSDLPWAVRNSSPEADVPDTTVAYHSGGLYEVVLALLMLALIWPLRDRFQRPGTLLWTMIALYSAGRFAMFFYRDDSSDVIIGLNDAQLTSLGLIALAAIGIVLARRRDAGVG